jgi:outer membrane protein OmpA-like peptidoglycan-associated protein
MNILKKSSRRPLIVMLLASACSVSATGLAADLAPDLPPPLGLTMPSIPLSAALTLSTSTNTEAAAQATMRFITLGRVNFVSNKWELSDSAKQTLDAVSGYLATNPGASRLLLDGHTDREGGFKFNDNLSDKRAMAVQAYLSDKGIDPALIHWKGHGKHDPVDENWTRLGRGRNRQVELYAVYPSSP